MLWVGALVTATAVAAPVSVMPARPPSSDLPGLRAENLAGTPVPKRGIRVTAPAAHWMLSADFRLAEGARADILGDAISLRREAGRVMLRAEGKRRHLPRATAAHHVQAVIGSSDRGAVIRTTVDGYAVAPVRMPRKPTWTVLAAPAGGVTLGALMTSRFEDPVDRLLHRLLTIAARTPPGRQPLGQGGDGRLRFANGWTIGFFSSALWHAFDLTGAPLFRDLALRQTLDNIGSETSDTHDLGFMYERSSVAAWRRLCARGTPNPACPALEASGLRAADALARLQATNAAAGLIPTRSHTLCRGCSSLAEADTIIDSLMNLPLLFWGAGFPGRENYRTIAVRHALRVAQLLVRRDSSTWQAIHVRRVDGAVLRRHTHQGLRDASTWSRGQAWAVYGFAAAALAARSPELARLAERTAGYVARHLPRDGVPRWDFDAPREARRDVSAATITAAGLVQLADACRVLQTCRTSSAWLSLAQRMLRGALAHVGRGSDAGVLGQQVYSLGGRTRWDDDAELIWGLDFALEAASGLRRERR